jgi:hypothetical membrane protein
VLTVVYLVVQPIVAADFAGRTYSFSEDSISDLGTTKCGPFQAPYGPVAYVCSPRHVLMNVAIVAAGALTVAGAGLSWAWWPRRKLTAAGLGCMMAAGVGGILVGFAPQNVNVVVHAIGSLLQVPGAVGMLLIGIGTRRSSGAVRWLSISWGAFATAASLLFLGNFYTMLGPGGMERAAIDTRAAWTVVIGGLVLRRPAPAP